MAREKGHAAEDLGEDAADGPDVDALVVGVPSEEDLGRAVPAGGDILGEVAFVGDVVDEGSGEAEVADLDFAVGVDEEVFGFLKEGMGKL